MPPISKPRRVLAYARVSSVEQALGTSLKDQENVMRAHAKMCGVLPSAVAFYVEAESGIREKEEKRVQMQALLRDVGAGDLVLVDKIDRWSRDIGFTHTTVKQILAKGASFYAVGDALDPSTDVGDTMLGYRALAAKEEHKRIRLRTVGTRKLLRAQGLYSEGPPPYGYRRFVPDKKEDRAKRNVLVIDKGEAETVRLAFELCASGRSHADVSAVVGLKASRLKLILRTRTYLGEMRNVDGDWKDTPHIPAIVARDLFFKAQDAITARKDGPPPGKGQTRDWILRDICFCGLCGKRCMVVYGGKQGARTPYYRCAKRCRPGGLVRQRDIEAIASPMVLARLVELREELAREPKKHAPSKEIDFDARRVRLQSKRARFVDAYGEGNISKEDFRARIEAVDADIARVDAEANKTIRRSPLADRQIRRAALKEITTLAKAWTAATPMARRAIVKQLASACRLVKGESPVFVWRSVGELVEHPG